MRQRIVIGEGQKEFLFEFPDQLTEITLGQLLEKSRLEEEKADMDGYVMELMMYKEFGEDEDGKEFGEDEFNLAFVPVSEKIYDNIISQLSLFLSTDQARQLEDIPYTELPLLLEDLVFEQEVDEVKDPEIIFTSHEICAVDIKRINQTLKDEYLLPEEEQKLKFELQTLQKGKLILIPAKDVMFQSRIATDNIQKQLPQIPKEIREDMEEEGLSMVDLYNKIINTEYTSIKQYKQHNRRAKAIASYVKKYETGYYDMAPKLLSHVCIPVGLEYHFEHAEARSEAFKTLDVFLVKQLLAFFLHMNDLSTDGTMWFSKSLKKLLLKN